jgi:hypothetical protein
MSTHKMPRDVLGARDRRYSVQIEYCGKSEPHYVARF